MVRERSRGRLLVSHAGRDTAWAEWLAWQLEQAGYRVELDVWDWAPGEDFITRMQQALQRADRLLAVCTEVYFASTFGGAELRAAFAQQAAGRVVRVLVEPVTLPPLYAPLLPNWLAMSTTGHTSVHTSPARVIHPVGPSLLHCGSP